MQTLSGSLGRGKDAETVRERWPYSQYQVESGAALVLCWRESRVALLGGADFTL